MQQDALFVKMALAAWNSELNAASKLIDQLSDDELMQEIAPSRNRGIYLLGHLVAVHDLLLPLLRLSDPLYPALRPAFIDEADKAVSELPSISSLRAQWKEVNSALAAHFQKLTPAEWFERHASISPEDFVNEPQRNRLNVLLSRTSHLAYHRGQMVFLAHKK